ncbi:HdeD family acid-resistance protein [Leifsonia sp. SIMBA_070]|uniref:HdeD family acid-resistance protein n=1 Tax=Leifsonia sp. SIMBA_070 TaxID=3085810 RepID=UPI00397B27B2
MATAVPAQNPSVHAHSRYWVVPTIRAIVALAAGAVITFTRDAHTPLFGLVVFGLFAIVDGLATGILSWLFAGRRLTRTLFAVQGAIGVIAGVLSLSLTGAGLGLFLYLVTVWAALTGFLELYSGIRERGRDAAARDWLITGAITAVLALVLLFVPADAVLAIGLFGAWAVIVGVFQGIGAATLRSASRATADAPGAESRP